MTYVLELKPETARFIEEKAAQSNLAPEQMALQILDEATNGGRRARLMKMADELFDERASAYEALAEGAK
ncbi:hypothetical protein B1R32_11117 [Abditibacterium utsteinense]|uniref:Uncharacterized protein n=1 Tax=Abditibacterium utsteinense TaxID=1960156 RepID=A0A2S8SRQ4_9BACT|nr:hypothetical protein [Abditibacterium utsteinense]PQV63456.1 hypothetical protein B1R32_11117 [Abditibacterium utsteinense]